MNLQEFIEKATTLDYSKEDAKDLVCVIDDLTSLRLRRFNIMSCGDGRYEILRSDERDSFYKMLDSQDDVFVGTLEEAYDLVFASLLKHYEIYKDWAPN